MIEEIAESVELVEDGANMIGVKDSAALTMVDGDKSDEIIGSKTDLGVQVDEKVGVGESETRVQKGDGLRDKSDAKKESEPTIVDKNIGKRESELDGKKDKNEGPDEGHKSVPRSGLGRKESAESKSKIGDLKEQGSPKMEKELPTSTGQNIAKTKLDAAKDENIPAKDKGGGVHGKKSDKNQKEAEKTKDKDTDSVIEQKDALMADKKDTQTETTPSDAKKAFKEMSSEEITVPEKTEDVPVVEKGFAEATQEEVSGKSLKDDLKVTKDEVLLKEQSDKGKRIIEEKTSVKESGKEKSFEDQVPLPGNDIEAKKVVEEGDVSVKESESKDGADTKDLTDGSGESKTGIVKQESPKSEELSTGKELANDKESKSDPRAIKAPIKKDSSPRKGKLKMDGDSWKKDTRKKRGTADRDRVVEITVLSRTGKLKDKLKSCESRDVESSDQWKKEVKKTAKKHKSLDEEAEKELKELSRRRELKERVQACNEKDQDTASAWSKEIKTKSQKSLDEETESELNEIAKESKLKNRLQECQGRDEESTNAFKKIIKKDAKRTLDADTESELRAIAQSGALKNRIEECEGKDKESVVAWKKEVKKGDVPPKISEVQTDVSEEMKEFAASGRLKTLIESCADREGQEDRSWKTAKKSDEHEELKELAKTVDVKSRIKSKIEGQESQPEGPPKGFDPHEDEELKEINLKGRIEAYGGEVVKVGATGEFVPIKEDATAHDTTAKATAKGGEKTKGKTLPGKTTGKISPPKWDGGRASPTKKGTKKEIGRASPPKIDPKGRTSPTKREPGRISPAKLETGRMSPTKRDTGRTSPTKRDTGRISPTKGDTSSEAKADSGRTSPAKLDLKGKAPAAKKDATGRSSPVKDKAAGKSKLADIRSNLLDGGKGKIKSKRESLERVTKKAGIRDKIAACKQRDKSAPARQLPVIEKAPARPRPKTAAPVQNEAVDLTPVNRAGEETGPEQEEPVDVDIKGKMSYWEAPKTDGDETAGGEVGANEGERPAPVILGNVKQAWEKKNRKIKTGEFVKALLDAKCKRRDLKDIADVKSDTKKYLVLPKSEPQEEGETKKEETKEKVRKSLEKNIETQNKKNVKKSAEDETKVRKTFDDFSLDDIANPDEVKQ